MNNVLIIAGGTGGHIYPGIAVAEALQLQGYQLSWLGSVIGMERQLVADRFEFHAIDTYQLRGKGLKAKLLLPWRLSRAIWQAWRLLRQLKPDVVIAFGGFVSGPGSIAARLLKIPLIIHEQNARAGLTNRWLAKIADTVLEAFPDSFPKKVHAVTVGNPVRESILDIAEPALRLSQRQGQLRILILGGSLGALAINNAVVEWFASYPRREAVSIKHQTGKAHSEAVREAYQQRHVTADVVAFIEDMPAALSWADVVICRAGALSVAEIAVVGLAAIFIPMPHSVDNHQYHNAHYLVSHGAGIMLEQSQLCSQQLSFYIDRFVDDREHVLQMSLRARELAYRDATQRIVKMLSNCCD